MRMNFSYRIYKLNVEDVVEAAKKEWYEDYEEEYNPADGSGSCLFCDRTTMVMIGNDWYISIKEYEDDKDELYCWRTVYDYLDEAYANLDVEPRKATLIFYNEMITW